MDYSDNPMRPRHRFWFGPMTMIQFLSDTGLLPGTSHDISMYAAKLGIQGALQDIQNNHPNDLVSMILFSRPHYQGEPADAGNFSQAQYQLSNDYAGMINSLWFPPNSSKLDVRPFDTNGIQTPRAHGDYTGNTATDYGLMLSYNQFSAASYSPGLGGPGRKGSQRLIILETDGMANVVSNAGFTKSVSGTTNKSYYKIGPSDTVTVGSGSAGTAALNVATKLCALTTDSTNGPGFATPTKPVILHVIAFGAIFEDVTPPPAEQVTGMALFQSLSKIGGTGFPASVSDTSDPNAYKIVTGTIDERRDKLKQAFINIMDSSIPVSLIK